MSLPQLLLVLVLLVTLAVRPTAALSADTACPREADIAPCRCTVRADDIQIWCSHSDLSQVVRGLQNVAQHLTRSVDELILENNYLPSLPGKLFSALRVTRLMLRDNGLERVASSWLAGLEDSLLELFVVEPRLRTLPADSLEHLHGLEAITLQGGVMKRLPRFSGLSRLRYVQIQSPALIELSPHTFRSLPDLEQLHVIFSPHVTRLEAGLLHDLPRLRLLNVSSCGLTWIHPRALARLPSLAEISFTGNRLLDAGTVGRAVRDTATLSVLHLDHNLIDRLAEASFVDMPALRELRMAGNRITEIHRGAFHRVPTLRMLELSRNGIRRVHPEAFLQRSDSGVEELWLTHNSLAHADELRALLDALPRLRYLDVSYNYIEAIPFGALRGHATLEQLHLDHNRIQHIEREAFTAMPALRELRLRNNSISSFTDGPFWNLPALKGLDMAHNYLRHLDARLVANLPSLRRLDVSNNAINDVDGSTFVETPALEHVNLSGNALVTIHPVTFRNLVNLYEVDMGWNRLRELVPGLPRGLEHLRMPHNQVSALPMAPPATLPHLRVLDLTDNSLQRLPPGALGSMSLLRTLRLGGNALQRLEEGSLSGLGRLELLDLHDNRLQNVHGRCLRDTKQLRVLDLRGNRLTSLHPELLRETTQLQKLDLSRNQLTDIPNGALDTTRELLELDASRNVLTEFPLAVARLPSLEMLDLSSNLLSTLPVAAMGTLPALAEFRLARNRLEDLPAGAFHDLPRLALLDLANNELRTMARGSLHALPELRALRLGYNRLSVLQEGVFIELPRLRSAELQHNVLMDIANNAFLAVPHLSLLNLSHNELNALERAGLHSLPSLEVLDLSHNHLTRVPADSLAGMEWLVELNMDSNNICSIQGVPFNGMPRLRVLSLRSNRMTTLREPVFQKLRRNVAVLDVAGNPLACSCSMLWLQAWFRDAGDADVGPRCADGSLLKELRLSRQQCKNRNVPEPVVPGCDVTSEHGGSGTSQILSTWVEVKDSTPIPPQTAPSPEESEYFYDEYVEYQYDENSTLTSNASSGSLVVTTPLPHATAAVQAASASESINPTQLSSHYIPGDTPTFYAGSRHERNKTQIEPLKIPQPIPPSSSGLTFFGIPLPSLNLGGLWGSARKADTKPGEVKFIGARGKVQMLPPNNPKAQTGGFIPMLPESGGFMPIANPILTQNRSHGNHLNAQHQLKVNYTSWDHPRSNTTTLQITNTSSVSNYEHNSNIKRGPLPALMNPSTYQPEDAFFSGVTTSKTNTRVESAPLQTNFLDPFSLHTSKLQPTPISPHTTAASHIDITEENSKWEENSSISSLSVNELGHKTTSQIAMAELNHMPNKDKKQKYPPHQNPDPTLIPVVMETTSQTHMLPAMEDWGVHWFKQDSSIITDTSRSSTEPLTSSLSSNYIGMTTTKSESGRSMQGPTSLSALLVPGGQQPQYRQPGGRPTITKVTISPPGPDPIEEYLRGPEPNTNKNFNTEPTKNTSMDWYFKNYNRTNLEPYVGPGKRALSSHDNPITVNMFAMLLVVLNLL